MLTFVLPALTCSPSYPQDTPSFYMKLNLVTEEHSKDSNSQSYKIEITNNHVQYKFRYGGYRPGPIPEPDEDFYLSEKETLDLFNRIKRYRLLKNVEEKKETKGLGSSIRLNLTIQMGDKTYQSNIEGMMYLFRFRKSNLEYIKYAKRVNSIARFIHNRALDG